MAQINWLDIVALGKKVESFLVWSWLEEQTLMERQQKLQEVMDLLTDGTLRPPEGDPLDFPGSRRVVVLHAVHVCDTVLAGCLHLLFH
jgi:hypothetical protein